MPYSLPLELWRDRVLLSFLLSVCDLVNVRSTSRSDGASVITADVLLTRLDSLMARHGVIGLIDIDRTAPVSFGYVLRAAYVLEQGASTGEWPKIAIFIRLAAIYHVIEQGGLPLMLPAQWLRDNLPTKASFHEVPLSMAVYKTIGHLMSFEDRNMQLAQQAAGAGQGAAAAAAGPQQAPVWVAHDLQFVVVSEQDLPANHPYHQAYRATDPVVRDGSCLHPTFTNLLTQCVFSLWYSLVRQERLLDARVGEDNPKYRSLLTQTANDDDCFVISWREDRRDLNAANPREQCIILMSGYKEGDSFAAYLRLSNGFLWLYTTETAVGGGASGLDKYPETMRHARRVLGRYGLLSDVLDGGTIHA
ncbi:unnamed protein product [Vitrella brassicaformis CCMP3155]|uniref:Uncharacterized protein n=2 Tax=Vitrella brassicaformis TaxID=1169539 RepID=A0A0G4EFP1_VITBC|nr:unnamed protein product [Vitrella brassicaformis CCMP3155]|eukprot:CEL95325.1 unnamed protein product [Vitrella brassicaformis CCMP3155]